MIQAESGEGAPAPGNAPAYTVSELSSALKRTLEDAYGYVRLRGEVSKVTRHASGHVYLTLKDERACIDAVIWKGQARALAAQAQQGLEVIAAGRITTYPGQSKYQLIVEALEPAGVGALLAQLERLKAKLQAEGLFDPARKRPLPRSPAVIGVVTSPTGAVIRDILHRIRDRWPCHVLVWPVAVQGQGAAAQVVAALKGFDALGPSGPVPRPDVVIVARGGGSVEDLWPFNDETLARQARALGMPVISAIGHETDTTLIDFAADWRAPTPTAAAEAATPVLAELKAQILGLERRLVVLGQRLIETEARRLAAAARALGRPYDRVRDAEQRLDTTTERLKGALLRRAARPAQDLARLEGRLTPGLLGRRIGQEATRLAALAARLDAGAARAPEAAALRARLPDLGVRLDKALERRLDRARERLDALDQLRRSLDPDRPLGRGFARVHHADGTLAHSAAGLKTGEAISLVFADGRRDAVVDAAAPRRKPRSGGDDGQDRLF